MRHVSSGPVLELSTVSKRFGAVQALTEVDLALYAGEVVALVGDNGAGKSTLVNVVTGVSPADSGEIRWQGRRATIRAPRDAQALGIAAVYQDLALCNNLDATANLFLGGEETTGGVLDSAAMERRTRELLDSLSVRLPSVDRPVVALSGGQRQAVAIARAVYFNARILIMDEPTAALGPAETAQVRNLVRQLKDDGIGIFLISHDIHDVFDLSDRISVMYHGRVVDTVNKNDVTADDVLGMIILGKKPGEVTEKELAEIELRG
jgi:D-xylose transport system ATP-binding protein